MRERESGEGSGGREKGVQAINEQLLDMRRAQTILETGRGQATFFILHYCRKLCKLQGSIL